MWSFDGCVGEGATSSLPAGGRVEKTISTPLCGEGVKEHIGNGHPDSLTAHPDRPPTPARHPDSLTDRLTAGGTVSGDSTPDHPPHTSLLKFCA